MRPMATSPAEVQAYVLFRQTRKGVVDRLDQHLDVLAVLGHGHIWKKLPGGRALWLLNLEDETGVSDGLVLLTQGLSGPKEEGLLAGVVAVISPRADAAGPDGRDEALDVLALYGRLECRDVGLDGVLSHILHRASAHPHLLRLVAGGWPGRRDPRPHWTAGTGVPQTGRIKARKVTTVATACPSVLGWPV